MAKRVAKQALLYTDSKNENWYNTFEVNLILPIKIYTGHTPSPSNPTSRTVSTSLYKDTYTRAAL